MALSTTTHTTKSIVFRTEAGRFTLEDLKEIAAEGKRLGIPKDTQVILSGTQALKFEFQN